MRNIIIAGGGMSGLVTARLLAENKDDKITIIEKSNKFGGLYTSTVSESGYVFDHGSHTVLNTGVQGLDEILFEDFVAQEWDIVTSSLKETVYFMGEHTDNTVCPDARKLPADIYAKGLAEFMNLKPSVSPPQNLEEKLYTTYGETFSDYLIRPIIEKFYDGDFKDLDPEMYKDFLPLSRIILFDDEMTRRLKTIPYFDDRIAWPHFKNGNSEIKKYFSRKGGVGIWPSLIEKKIRELGVSMMPETAIKKIIHHDGVVSEVELEDGEVLPCDELIWTVPAFGILAAAGLPVPKSERPALLQSYIYNFVFDKKLLKDDHWIFNYDKNMETFRVTLYPNLTIGEVPNSPHHMTMEVLRPTEDLLDNPSELWNQLFNEAVKMGLISADTKIIEKYCYAAAGARPIPTTSFKKTQAAQIEAVKSHFSNVKLFGRGNGAHFMNPLLREIWWGLQDIDADPQARPKSQKVA